MSSTLIEDGNMTRITPDPLSLQEITDFVTDSAAGGVSIFMGNKRHTHTRTRCDILCMYYGFPTKKGNGKLSGRQLGYLMTMSGKW